MKKEVENDFTALIKKYRHHTSINDDMFVKSLVNAYQENTIYFNAIFGKFGDLDYLYRLSSLVNLEVDDSNEKMINKYIKEFHFSITVSFFRLWLQNDEDLFLNELIELIRKLYTNGISY